MNSINSLTKPSVNLFIETIMLSHLLNPILIAYHLLVTYHLKCKLEQRFIMYSVNYARVHYQEQIFRTNLISIKRIQCCSVHMSMTNDNNVVGIFRLIENKNHIQSL